MADLITHGCVAIWFKAVSGRPHTPVFVAGALAPDICSRAPSLVMALLLQNGIAVPLPLVYAWEPLHLPVGMVLLAFLVSMAFAEKNRRMIFANFLGGMFLHLFMDLFQRHIGVGYLLGFPCTTASFEFGLMGSEATVLWVPLCVLVTVVVVQVKKWRFPKNR